MFCVNLAWPCVAVYECVVCVCAGRQGVNKQQIPQGRVHSVDMLLKPNFLIFQLNSHLASPPDMQRYWTLLFPPRAPSSPRKKHQHITDISMQQAFSGKHQLLHSWILLPGFFSKAQRLLSNKTFPLSLTRGKKSNIITSHSLSQSHIVQLCLGNCFVFHMNPAEEAFKCTL